MRLPCLAQLIGRRRTRSVPVDRGGESTERRLPAVQRARRDPRLLLCVEDPGPFEARAPRPRALRRARRQGLLQARRALDASALNRGRLAAGQAASDDEAGRAVPAAEDLVRRRFPAPGPRLWVADITLRADLGGLPVSRDGHRRLEPSLRWLVDARRPALGARARRARDGRDPAQAAGGRHPSLRSRKPVHEPRLAGRSRRRASCSRSAPRRCPRQTRSPSRSSRRSSVSCSTAPASSAALRRGSGSSSSSRASTTQGAATRSPAPRSGSRPINQDGGRSRRGGCRLTRGVKSTRGSSTCLVGRLPRHAHAKRPGLSTRSQRDWHSVGSSDTDLLVRRRPVRLCPASVATVTSLSCVVSPSLLE